MKNKEFNKSKQLQFHEIKNCEGFTSASDEEATMIIESLRVLSEIIIAFHFKVVGS